MAQSSLLSVRELRKEYAFQGRSFNAISNLSFDIAEGETLGLVGESGCGKSTAGRSIIQLPRPTGGSVMFEGQDLTKLSDKEMRRVRSRLQIIFQDPISSLNPRRKVRDIVAEPLVIAGVRDKSERDQRVRDALSVVGIDPDLALDRRPHQFSGGQCQRICIARALVMEPKLIICDEPVSALDVSVQAQILNLLHEMKDRYGLTLMFISHDLAVVKNVSDRVAVMYLGKMCELTDSDTLYRTPAHPYTEALFSSIPEIETLGAERAGPVLAGEIPSPVDPPDGCRFWTRCPYVQDKCRNSEPEFKEIAPRHFVACHFPLIDN